MSDDANAMLLYLGRCEDEGRRPDHRRAELALVELTVRGFIANPNAA